MEIKKVAKMIESYSGVKFAENKTGDFVFKIKKSVDNSTYTLKRFPSENLVLMYSHDNPYYPISCDSKTQSLQISGFDPQDRIRVFMETIRKAQKAAIYENTLSKLVEKYDALVDKTDESLSGVDNDESAREIIDRLWGDDINKIFKIHRKICTEQTTDFYTQCPPTRDYYCSFVTSVKQFVLILTDANGTYNKQREQSKIDKIAYDEIVSKL